MQRREWIKLAGLSGLALSTPSALLGKELSSEFVELTGQEIINADDRIELLVPEDAANGAVVPVGVISSIPATQKIILMVNNHFPTKVIELDTSASMLAPRLSTHLKLENPATITALIQSDSGWYSRTAQVKTLGEKCEE